MNPDLLYRQYRDDALADQIEASEYSTFVAMPFRNTFSYRSQDVYTEVIQAAANRANLSGSKRRFAMPERVDEQPGTAGVITERIVRGILSSHFFMADLTFENPGVLLETGIALGLKSNHQIILITQGRHEDLHFDIRNNAVLTYNNDAVDPITEALLAAAEAFENDADTIITSITSTLSPEAVICLLRYAQEQQRDKVRSLLYANATQVFPEDKRAHERFVVGMQDLLRSRLVFTR